jgi:hypothetical protein
MTCANSAGSLQFLCQILQLRRALAPVLNLFNYPLRRSNRGGRVPMVLHSTCRVRSISRISCSQLEGWRPQSSDETSSGTFTLIWR